MKQNWYDAHDIQQEMDRAIALRYAALFIVPIVFIYAVSLLLSHISFMPLNTLDVPTEDLIESISTLFATLIFGASPLIVVVGLFYWLRCPWRAARTLKAWMLVLLLVMATPITYSFTASL